MLFKRLSVAAAMLLMVSAVIDSGKAVAVATRFSFSNFTISGSGDSASGYFDIDDTLGSIPGEVEFATELIDYEITTTFPDPVSPTSTTVVTPVTAASGGFGEITTITGVSVTSTLLDFTTATGGAFRLDTDFGLNDFNMSPDFFGNPIMQINTSENAGGQVNSCCTLQATAATVPFEFSPSLGLLAMGGIFGFSQLRKRIVARKLIDKEVV